jgi:hypothetical protein
MSTAECANTDVPTRSDVGRRRGRSARVLRSPSIQCPVVFVSLPAACGLRVSRQGEKDLSLHAGPAPDPGRRPRAPAQRFLWGRRNRNHAGFLKARTR